MRSSFRRSLFASLVALAFAAFAMITSAPASAATFNWAGGTSFWDIVTNWSSNPPANPPALPGLGDDVVINLAGAQTVTHRLGNDTVNSIEIDGANMLAVTGGVLTVANSFSAAATTTLSAGTLTLNGISTMASLTLSGGTLGGTGTVTVAGPSLWLAGTQTGTGTTVYSSALAASALL